MAYQNYPTYNPNYYQTMPFSPSQPSSAPFLAQRHEIIQVNGKNGAEAFQMAPNSRVLLLDETAPIVWLVVTDGAGYKTVTPYDIAPSKTAEQKESAKIDALEKRLNELEEKIDGIKSYSGNSKPRKTATGGADDSAV